MAPAERMADTPSARVPVPDPTVLTMEALLREVQHVKDLLLTKVECMQADVLRMDKANAAMPEEWNKGILHVKEFMAEKLNTVQEQFRSVQTKFTDSKVAVDVALSAQKEAAGEQNKSSALAIGKTETAFTKSIDEQAKLLASNNVALDGKIVDIKARIDKLEGSVNGKNEGRQESHATTFNAANIIGMIVGVVGLVIAAITVLAHVPR